MEMSGEKRADGRENLIDAHPIESRLDRHFYFFTHRLDPHSKSTKWVKMTSISRKIGYINPQNTIPSTSPATLQRTAFAQLSEFDHHSQSGSYRISCTIPGL